MKTGCCINCATELNESNTARFAKHIKEPVLCDECQIKVLRFLYLAERVNGSAVSFFYRHRWDLRRKEGMSEATLEYIRTFCKRLDDPKARKVKIAKKTARRSIKGPEAVEDDLWFEENAANTLDAASDGETKDPAQAVDEAFFVNEDFAAEDARLPIGEAEDDEAMLRLPKRELPATLAEQEEKKQRQNRFLAACVATAAAFLIIVAVIAAVVTLGGEEKQEGKAPEKSGVSDVVRA